MELGRASGFSPTPRPPPQAGRGSYVSGATTVWNCLEAFQASSEQPNSPGRSSLSRLRGRAGLTRVGFSVVATARLTTGRKTGRGEDGKNSKVGTKSGNSLERFRVSLALSPLECLPKNLPVFPPSPLPARCKPCSGHNRKTYPCKGGRGVGEKPDALPQLHAIRRKPRSQSPKKGAQSQDRAPSTNGPVQRTCEPGASGLASVTRASLPSLSEAARSMPCDW